MNNPLALFRNLRNVYLRYLDSPFDFRYADLVRERRALLDRDGYLWREPLIEPIPAYRGCGGDFRTVAHGALDGSLGTHCADELADFVACGAFGADMEPYEHQRDSFEESVVRGRDVVVTTGTGSGKTECFVLPVLAALVRESAAWGAAGVRNRHWDWWNHYAMRGDRRRWEPRVPQRSHEDPASRPPAIRALLLYPLNALVEDQLIRLRESLDSSRARAWLDMHRRGNRFYFGRYTGRTPVSGGRTAGNTARLRAELCAMERDALLVANDPEARRFFPTMDGGEMWSRWDMQDAPPDLLITNYCMLNIMLMRDVEAGIFGATRRWLADDRSRVFHLVVDELHTYRGTPGTEVAYLLRVLLDRLGISPDSDQLRIIASSASLESGVSGLAYLEEFFGRDRSRFRVVGGSLPVPDATAIITVRERGQAFREFREAFATHQMILWCLLLLYTKPWIAQWHQPVHPQTNCSTRLWNEREHPRRCGLRPWHPTVVVCSLERLASSVPRSSVKHCPRANATKPPKGCWHVSARRSQILARAATTSLTFVLSKRAGPMGMHESTMQ